MPGPSTRDLFALSPEEHPLQLLDKQRQALDLARARVESRLVSLLRLLEE
jgi:hypothetical protein